MKKGVNGFLIGFLSVLTLGAFIAWLAGYNFDSRSPVIAGNFCMILLIGILVGFVCAGLEADLF